MDVHPSGKKLLTFYQEQATLMLIFCLFKYLGQFCTLCTCILILIYAVDDNTELKGCTDVPVYTPLNIGGENWDDGEYFACQYRTVK